MSERAARRAVRILIQGTNLPGAAFAEHRHVHVGVQCRTDAIDLVPGDAPAATFEFDADVLSTPDGRWDFRGPYVHGKRGERFVYLAWGDRPPGGDFAMFRRAKLHLSCLDPDLVAQAAEAGHRLVSRLSLTDAKGGPRCASLRPPAIAWTVEPEGA